MKEYYESYWKKRLDSEDVGLSPIRQGIPRFLIKYSQYGSCLNLLLGGAKILDVGCGEGNVSELYIKKKNNIVFGIEISETAGILAKERGVKVIKWDLNDTPYPFESGTFEVVTITDVLEHVINPINLLTEARRILRPEGKIIVQVPNFSRLGNRIRMLFAGDPRDKLHWGGYGDGMEHLHWFTQPKLREFLVQTGFSDIIFHAVGLPFGFIFGLLRCHNLAELLLIEAKA